MRLFASIIVPASSSADSGQTETLTISGIIRSGVALIDDWITGVRDGGVHLLTGGPGSGKSTLALHFADAALRRGKSVAMLVHSRTDDVKSHARYVGVDLETPLRDGRLVLLRYRSDFVHSMAHVVSPGEIVGDLERFVFPLRPARIVIDSFAPFVAGASSRAQAGAALATLLEQSGATSFVTFPEDVSEGYDRTLEPIVQSASLVMRLSLEEGGVRRADLLNIRYPAPMATTTRFVIRPDVGVVGEHLVRAERLTLRIP